MILNLAINTRNSSCDAYFATLCPIMLDWWPITVSIDSLYSNLKAVTKPVDTNYSKAAFEDIKKLRQ